MRRQQRRHAVQGVEEHAHTAAAVVPNAASRAACARGTPTSACRRLAPGTRQQRRRGLVGHHAAGRHHHHPRCQQQCLGHVVRHQHRRQPQFVVQRPQPLSPARRASPGRARRRLRRAAAPWHRAPGPGPALPAALPPGEFRRPMRRQRPWQFDLLEGGTDVHRRPFRQPWPDGDVLRHAQVGEQADVLEDITDPPPKREGWARGHVTPSRVTRPALGSTSRLTIFSSVDLPDPDAPTSATKDPGATPSDTSSTAAISP